MAAGMAVEAVTAGVEAVTAGVGFPRFTAEVAAGMAEAVATMVAWHTWVMGGVAVHRAHTAGLTRIQHFPVTLLIISVTITQISVTITQISVAQ